MNPDTTLLRQVHPTFAPDGKPTSQAFLPFPKDDARLSAYNGDRISAADSFEHYTGDLQLESVGVWGVTCQEVESVELEGQEDPLPNSPHHAVISFEHHEAASFRKLAKKLKAFALRRGCLFAA